MKKEQQDSISFKKSLQVNLMLQFFNLLKKVAIALTKTSLPTSRLEKKNERRADYHTQ